MTTYVPGGVDGVSVRAVQAYLRAQGWTREQASTQLPVEFWARDSTELMVPLNVGATDFKLRWQDLVSDLASAQRRATDDVDRDLSIAQYDVMDVHAEHDDDSDFTVTLSDGVDLITNAKAMVISAACSTLERRSHHGKSRPRLALEQARSVRMSQTRRGSYIIPIISPVVETQVAPEEDEVTLLPDIERQMFSRRVMATMATGLAALHQLGVQAEQEPTVLMLAEAVVRQGLSAELATSVANMAAASDVSQLRISVRWSLITSQPTVGPVDVAFPKDAVTAVRKIGELLRERVTVHERIIYGAVTSLERDQGESVGTVTIKAIINRRERPIRVALSPDDYHVATQAHDAQQRIVVSGNVVTESGHTLRMTDVRFFQLESLTHAPLGLDPE